MRSAVKRNGCAIGKVGTLLIRRNCPFGGVLVCTVVSLLLSQGCMNGAYKIESSAEEPKTVMPYEVVDSLGAERTYSTDKMPIVVRDWTPGVKFDQTGIILWGMTLGIFPCIEEYSSTHEVEIETPLGSKKTRFTAYATTWSGWLPCIIPYPCVSEERAYHADKKGLQKFEQIGKERAVNALVGQFTQQDYVTFAETKNKEREMEVARIKEVSEKVNDLLSKNMFDDALAMIETESKARKGTWKCDESTWGALTRLTKDKREDYRVANKKADLEKKFSESKFEDVVVECAKENAGEERYASIWVELKSKAEKSISERDRKIELARIEKRKAEISKLIEEKKYAEAIKECVQEAGAGFDMHKGWRSADREIWEGLEQDAKKALATERVAKYRPKELARINAKKEKLDSLLKEGNFDEVFDECNMENGGEEGSLPEDAQIWSGYRTRAWQGATREVEKLLAEKSYSKVRDICERELRKPTLDLNQMKYWKQMKRKAWAGKREVYWPENWVEDECKANTGFGWAMQSYDGLDAILCISNLYPTKGHRYEFKNFHASGKVDVCSGGVIVEGEAGSEYKKIFVYTDREYVDGMSLKEGWYGCVGIVRRLDGTMYCFVELEADDL